MHELFGSAIMCAAHPGGCSKKPQTGAAERHNLVWRVQRFPCENRRECYREACNSQKHLSRQCTPTKHGHDGRKQIILLCHLRSRLRSPSHCLSSQSAWDGPLRFWPPDKRFQIASCRTSTRRFTAMFPRRCPVQSVASLWHDEARESKASVRDRVRSSFVCCTIGPPYHPVESHVTRRAVPSKAM